MNITLIAAVGKNLELGKNNTLIWSIPEDLKFFRDNTIGKTIVMGMNTLKSLPKLLPNRKHVVLTRKNVELDPSIVVVHSIDELLSYIDSLDEYKNKLNIIRNNSCEEKYILQYQWKERDVNKSGVFKAFFEIKFNGNIKSEGVDFPKGILKVPIEEDLIIVIK